MRVRFCAEVIDETVVSFPQAGTSLTSSSAIDGTTA